MWYQRFTIILIIEFHLSQCREHSHSNAPTCLFVTRLSFHSYCWQSHIFYKCMSFFVYDLLSIMLCIGCDKYWQNSKGKQISTTIHYYYWHNCWPFDSISSDWLQCSLWSRLWWHSNYFGGCFFHLQYLLSSWLQELLFIFRSSCTWSFSKQSISYS